MNTPKKKTDAQAQAKAKAEKATPTASNVVKPVAVIHSHHLTEQYASFGKHVDDTATRKIDVRHETEKTLASGKATLQSIIALHGDGEAVLRIARLQLRGMVTIAGMTGHRTDVSQKLGKLYWSLGREQKAKILVHAKANPKANVKLSTKPKHVTIYR